MIFVLKNRDKTDRRIWEQLTKSGMVCVKVPNRFGHFAYQWLDPKRAPELVGSQIGYARVFDREFPIYDWKW
jgi:hypothetical protein